MHFAAISRRVSFGEVEATRSELPWGESPNLHAHSAARKLSAVTSNGWSLIWSTTARTNPTDHKIRCQGACFLLYRRGMSSICRD